MLVMRKFSLGWHPQYEYTAPNCLVADMKHPVMNYSCEPADSGAGS